MTSTGPQARRGVLVTELAVLVAAVAVDLVWQVRSPGPPGTLATVVGSFASPSGSAAAVLAVLRRRFPRHVLGLGVAVAALSLVGTALVAAGGGAVAEGPPTAEVCAAALLVGAGCRRLPPVRAGALP
ncbi:histidine kinase, partial [Saccharothrix lopnurensis]